MSYLVLARKYRPKTFSEMVGQEHVVQALSNALVQQRLHHAYLFTGTRGVGKTTVSRILAKSLNCQGEDGQGGITATPCGVCQACRDIDAGRFVDYTELDAASNRGVDEVQGLLEQAVYKPVQGRFKVFMIDEVHMLTNTAFNAMLKTLEEPPEYLKFVLATTDPQKVPVTVLSRCLQFNLRPMAPETVLEHLTRVLARESVPAEPQALRLLARAARGSMRDALSLTDQAIAFGSGQLQEAGVRQMLGSVDRSYVFRLIDALARGDGRTVVETSESLRMHGLSAASTLEEMSAVLQRMAVFQAVPQMADVVDPADPEASEIARLAGTLPADETQLLYSICLHGRTELGLAPDEYAALTMALLRLLAFKPAAEGGTPPAEKKTLKPPQAQPPAPEPEPASAAEPVPSIAASGAVSAPVEPATAAPPGPEPRPAEAHAPEPEPHSPAPLEPPSGEAPWADDAPPPAAVAATAAPAPVQEPSSSAAVAAAVRLPVRTPADLQAHRPAEVALPAASTPDFVAIPVRVAPEPGMRLQPAAAPGALPASARYTPTEEGDVWHATVMQLVAAEAINALVRELALQSQLVARDADHWLLRVERESLNQPTARERLRAALEAAGFARQISVEVGTVIDSPARRNAHAAAERQRRAQEIVENDPYVQALVRDFGARIVPGSIKPA
ncbi:DNA polymerase III subunit gamma/tau [Paracidovorax citrulli]|nr:DNA polymerase III subunit gamma/tau [Paracidovorax citrulli]PVY67446.1 DNA polymerase-3 subunit gamma/tau [Paracidovorax citrulli]QCX13063.1 DNA polymerase III subunit tau [Paracidovorax citrulli]RLJ92952.1 DNA polymerase-3 subunit gamma/tau [Paracidovorax citrulli]UEG48126.1 DNA polymerase III subunit gamma/tau [Paracidovorax citrulli]UMT83171.1 DNA polymerase III subunit gamma/tau [Paracidovorax citrulli]